MDIASFLQKLRQSGITFRTDQGKLLCSAPKGVLTPVIAEEIKQKKTEIIHFLEQVEGNRWTSLVPIQPTGTRPPFFCFHGAGGNVLNYSVLIPYLGMDQPLYGLQSRGLDGITPPFDRIEPMAEYYIQEIQKVQSSGPYYFGGGSMGGMIALEAAQQLQRRGEKIGILVMFDSLGPNQEITAAGRLLHRIRKNTITDLLAYARNRLNEGKSYKEKMAICLAHRERNEPIPHELRFWYIEQLNYTAMANYTYSIFQGEITLLKGSDEEGGIWSDPHRGWQGMATDGLKIYEIPGHHDTLVEEPLLGQRLAECLRNAQDKNVPHTA